MRPDFSTAYNSQDMEETEVFNDGGLEKEDVVYIIQWNITQPLKKNEIMPLAAATWMDSETE